MGSHCSIGRNELWLNKNGMNYINVNIHIKHILLVYFSQQWHTKLSNSTKDNNDNSFKDNIALENYFNILPKKKISLIMVRVQKSNHTLPVETERW